MKARTQKWLSILCVLALMLGLVPMTVSAADSTPTAVKSATPSSAFTFGSGIEDDTQKATIDGVQYTTDWKAGGATSASNDRYITVQVDAPSTLKVWWQKLSPVLSDDKTARTGDAGTAAFSGKDGSNPVGITEFSIATKGTWYIVFPNMSRIYKLELSGLHQHQWGEWTVTKEATCTEAGSRTHTCTDNDCPGPKTEEEEITALGHDFSGDVSAVAAGCITPGSTAGKKCSRCDETQGIEVVQPTGQHTIENGACKDCGMVDHGDNHIWDTGVETKAATCTEAGVRTLTCTVAKCGVTKTEDITALGHDKQSHPKVEPTCTKPGNNAYETCSRCDYTTYQAIPATGHTDADGDGKCDVCTNEIAATLNGAGGWFETMYVETNQFNPADVTKVSWVGASNGKLDMDGLKYLVRAGLNGGKTRIDIPGLKAGAYSLSVTANGTTYKAENVEVMAYDRSGYAHWKYDKGVGAYRDDGVLKDDAIVLYVNNQNKDTITVESKDGTTVTGIGHILNTKGMDTGGGTTDKGGIPNNNQNILRRLAKDGTPLVVRIIDDVKCPDGLTAFSSVDYGGTVGDNGAMARMSGAANVTIEGIGPNASLNGWGLHFMRQTSDVGTDQGVGFEVRNIAFRNVPEDCVGMEGIQEGGVITAPVERCWVHNCSFYVPTILNPAESDKQEGDGACDFKRGQYMTMSYCHFVGYHKTNLVGNNKDALQFNITWHHNWWEGCASRGPLSRNANIHIYNCWYDGNTDYAQDARANAYIFSEYNTLANCNRVQVTSKEGTGTIKSFNDVISGNQYAPEGTIVDSKTQVVDSKNKYKSFELHANESYIPDGDYLLDLTPSVYKAKIKAYAGPMKADIIGVEDVPSDIPADRTPTKAVVLPYDKAMNSTNAVLKGEKDNIIFNANSVNSSAVKVGKNVVGKDIVFMVDKPVDITVAGSGINLIDAYGNALVVDSGTASNCPAGIYAIQAAVFNKGQYKEGTVTALKIEAAKSATPPHEHSFTSYVQTVAPTCIREGVEKATCSCGESVSRSIAMISHNFQSGECTVCKAQESVLGEVDPSAPEVDVTGVTIVGEKAITIKQDDSQTLSATITPANATDKALDWNSSDETVATVTKRGVVTGKGPGTATITATAASGVSDSITVTVVGVNTSTYTFDAKKEGPAQITADKGEIDAEAKTYGTGGFFTNTAGNKWKAPNYNSKDKDLSAGALLLGAQEGGSLKFTVTAPATVKSVTLAVSSTSSSNYSAVALKNSKGEYILSTADLKFNVVSGTASRSVTFENLPADTYEIVAPTGVQPSDVAEDLEAFSSDGENPNKRGVWIRTASVTTVQVAEGGYVEVSGVTLDKTTANVEAGKTVELTATVAPADASNKAVTWTSSNSSVASVSAAGVVTGVKAGQATITAKAGSKSATCAVTVTAATQTAVKVTAITVAGSDGKTSGAVTANNDDEVILQLTADVQPEEADDKSLTWSVAPADKGVVVNSAGKVTVYANAVTGSVTITAAAKDGSGVKGQYTLAVTAAPCAHDWEWVETKAPTCAAKGVETKTCAVCGATDGTREVPALGHDTELQNVKAATCKETGYTGDAVCKVCGKTVTPGETVDKTSDHSYADGVCTVCGAEEGAEHTEHTFGDWQVTKKATCTAEGEEARYCTYGGCNEKETRKLDKLAHDYDADGVCTVCGDEQPSTPIYSGGGSGSVSTNTKTEILADGTKVTTTELSGGAEKENIVRPDGTKADMTYNKDGSATGTVTQKDGTKATVTTTKDGETTAKVTVPAKVDSTNVTIPAQNVTPGTVAVIVKDDGTEEIVRMSAPDEVGVKVKLDDSATVKLVDKAVKFVDMPGHWAEAKVDFVSARDLFKGTDAIHFTPNGTMTRAMMATVLFRLDGERKGEAKESFADVGEGTWYTDAVAWANDQGIVTGYSDAAFGPEDNVTREQLAVMIYRYAKAEGLVKEGEAGKLDYADAGSVNSWATEAVSWLTANGILTGKPGNLVDPQGNASRAEVATVLQRFVEFATK